MSKQSKTDSDWKTDKYKEALAYLDILANGSGTPISAEEDGKGAGVEMYAQLMHNFLTINYQNILCGFNSANRFLQYIAETRH